MYGMFLFGCFLLQGVNGTKLGFEHTNFIHGHYHGHYLQLLPVHLLGEASWISGGTLLLHGKRNFRDWRQKMDLIGKTLCQARKPSLGMILREHGLGYYRFFGSIGVCTHLSLKFA